MGCAFSGSVLQNEKYVGNLKMLRSKDMRKSECKEKRKPRCKENCEPRDAR